MFFLPILYFHARSLEVTAWEESANALSSSKMLCRRSTFSPRKALRPGWARTKLSEAPTWSFWRDAAEGAAESVVRQWPTLVWFWCFHPPHGVTSQRSLMCAWLSVLLTPVPPFGASDSQLMEGSTKRKTCSFVHILPFPFFFNRID